MPTLAHHLPSEQVENFWVKDLGHAGYYEIHVTWRSRDSWELGGPSQSCGPQKKGGGKDQRIMSSIIRTLDFR